MLLVILLYALLALTFTLGKAAVSYADPLFLIGTRMVVAGVLLLGFYFLKSYFLPGTTAFKPSKRDIIDFIQVTFFHVYLSFVPEFWALQFVSSIKVNIMYATTPFVALLLSYVLYREKITPAQLLGVCCGFVSLLPLMARSSQNCGNIFSFSLPELVLLVSIASAAYAWFVIKDLMNRGYSLALINGIAMLGGGLMSFVTWYIVHAPGAQPILEMRPFIITVAGLILLSNVVVYNLYGWLLRYYSVNFVACAGFLSPLFGAFYGYIFLHEILGWQHFLAIVGITIGLYLFFHDELRARRVRKSTPLVL